MSSQKKSKKQQQQKTQQQNNKQQQHKNKQKDINRSSCLGCDTSLDVHIPKEQVILLLTQLTVWRQQFSENTQSASSTVLLQNHYFR